MYSRRQFLATAASSLASPSLLRAEGDLGAAIARLGRPLRVLVPDGSQANVSALIAAFEASTGCPAEMVVVDLDDINATLALEAILPEIRVDVALPATFGIPELVDSAAIRPLDDLAARLAPPGLTDGLLYRAGDMFDGKLWGYQSDGDVYLMFYNNDMLTDPDTRARFSDRFGKGLEVPLTWEDLDQQIAFMHRGDGTRFGGCLFRTATYAAWEWWARFHAAGGVPFDEGFHPGIAGPAGQYALESMIETTPHLTGQSLGLFDNWARYDKGDIYANIGWGGTQKFLNRPTANMRDRVAHGPLPGSNHNGAPVPLAYFNWGWSLVVTRQCPEPELAYLFCQHSVSPQASTSAVAEVDGYFDPFRAEHYSDPRVISAYGESFLNQHRAAMAAPLPDLYIGRRGEYFDSLTFWLLRALAGDVLPDVALKSVVKSWEITTDLVGRHRQADRWAALHASYPERLRGLARPG